MKPTHHHTSATSFRRITSETIHQKTMWANTESDTAMNNMTSLDES